MKTKIEVVRAAAKALAVTIVLGAVCGGIGSAFGATPAPVVQSRGVPPVAPTLAVLHEIRACALRTLETPPPPWSGAVSPPSAQQVNVAVLDCANAVIRVHQAMAPLRRAARAAAAQGAQP